MRTGILLLLLLLTPQSSGQTTQPRGDKGATAADLQAAKSLERLYQAIGDEVLPSVVQVLPSYGDRRQSNPDARKSDDPLDAFKHFFGPGGTPRNRSTASGFVVDRRGSIVTNAHVVRNANAVFVRLHDDTVVEAQLIGTDEEIDLAVLRIPAGRAPPVKWGDSGRLRPGSIVMAMGSPFGLRDSVSQGIVSGLGRRGPGADRRRVFIQTDAAINPGNSGGPLVNLDSEVVGINTWVIAAPGPGGGVGFAVPSNLAREVVARIVNENLDAKAPAPQADAAWLGVIPARKARGLGVVLYHVFPHGPAAIAGLRRGDRLLVVDGKRVETAAVLEALVANLRAGRPVTIELEGRREPLELTPGRRPVTFDSAWRIEGAPPPTEQDPLSGTQRRTLRKALIDRYCPCPCGRALYDCFGCSAAKSDFSDADNLVRLGLSPVQISRRLDPPVLALVWADYTDPEGRKLLRTLDQLKTRYGPLLRVRRRYFPADLDDLDGWRRTINAIEIARAAGHYEAAHRLLLEENGEGWEQKLSSMPDVLGLDREDFEQGLAGSRYEQQIAKDLTAGPFQYEVTRSPSLRINADVLEEGFDLKKLTDHIERAILERAF